MTKSSVREPWALRLPQLVEQPVQQGRWGPTLQSVSQVAFFPKLGDKWAVNSNTHGLTRFGP